MMMGSSTSNAILLAEELFDVLRGHNGICYFGFFILKRTEELRPLAAVAGKRSGLKKFVAVSEKQYVISQSWSE